LARFPSVRSRPAGGSRSSGLRSPRGELTFLSDDAAKLRLLRDLPVVDLDAGGRERTIVDLYDV